MFGAVGFTEKLTESPNTAELCNSLQNKPTFEFPINKHDNVSLYFNPPKKGGEIKNPTYNQYQNYG